MVLMCPKFQISLAGFLVLAACSQVILGPSLEERYQEGKDEFLSDRAGDTDKAVAVFESVAREDPTYKDTLALLGRAYYRNGRYHDADAILERSVLVNRDDEIAWLALGLAQLRLGEDKKGLENLNRGLALLGKAPGKGHRDYVDWDSKRLVGSAIQRTVFLAAKGLEEKQNLIRSGDTLLIRIDDEENFQRSDSKQEYRRVYTGNQ